MLLNYATHRPAIERAGRTAATGSQCQDKKAGKLDRVIHVDGPLSIDRRSGVAGRMVLEPQGLLSKHSPGTSVLQKFVHA